ncbi:MAG: EAL domain-containing protein [Spirochaetales bacterium]|nr:EAL domain-containing protein [Spirochaetales bacterium]
MNFIHQITLIEILVPAIGSGFIFFGIFLFFYLYLKTKIDIYLATFFLGISALMFVFSEFFIIYLGGLRSDRNLGIYFHISQQLGGAWFIFSFPFFIYFVFETKDFFKKVNKILIYLGLFISISITLVAIIKPDLFISTKIPNTKYLIYAANYARGKEGFVYRLRDIILFIIIIYFYIILIFNIIKKVKLNLIFEIFIGLTIAILAAIDDIYFVYFDRYIGYFSQHPFSRFSFGLTIFTMLTMISIIKNFYKKALITEKLYNEIDKLKKDFTLISDNIDEVFWIYNHDLSELYFVSKSFSSIWPLPVEKVMEDKESWKNYIYEEDVSFVETYLTNYNHLSIIEYRINNNEKVIWIRDKFYRIKENNDNLIKWIRVSENITKLKEFQDELFSLYYFDSLTKLKNRKSFNEKVNEVIQLAAREKNSLKIVILTDIDNFSNINDKFGFSFGDEILIQFVDRVKNIIRKTDHFFRIGADEFAIILGNVMEKFTGTFVAEKIIEAIKTPFYVNGEEIYITLCFGISIYPDDANSPEDLVKKAEMALIEAKKNKNSVIYYNNVLNELSYKRINLEILLKKSLQNNNFILHFQPIYKNNKECSKVEVLLRLKDNNNHFISPIEFIPIAESTNLINQIGKIVIENTFKTIKTYFYDKEIVFSINISGKQLEDPEFINYVKIKISEYEISPHKINFEITESILINNMDENISKLYKIKELGIGLSLDDFGTGYSSFARLKLLPFDELKIDKIFIDNIAINNQDKEIVNVIIKLSQSLNMKVVAEGVENEVQFEVLKTLGCNYYQGYYFSKPVPIERLLEI